MKLICNAGLQVGDYVLETCRNYTKDSLIGQITRIDYRLGTKDITVLRNISGREYKCGESYIIVPSVIRHYLLTEEELIEHLILETI